VGIVQNRDDTITTIYDFGAVQDQDLKRRFIDLANTWWWESNRSIPINIFLRGEWDTFRPTLRTFANKDLEQKRRYLDLANTWWWESNRSIPINIFLRGEWDEFRGCLRTFVNKDLEILHGPVCSLNDIARRKGKRKSITLVRRME
jgi:hypothetical protein